MQDPIADMLTRIRNGQQAQHKQITLTSSILKEQIVKVLKEEGYVSDYHIEDLENNLKKMTVLLKYFKGKPVIDRIVRISRPGLRVYKTVDSLSAIPGFGIAILSTSKGVMTHVVAKSQGIGG